MNSQILKIKYLECSKGNLHEGEQLNSVCLNSECKTKALCCCACVDQMHKGHDIVSLKKFLLDAGKQFEGKKEQVKPETHFNTDIILNLIESSKKQTLQSFQHLKTQIYATLNQVQKNLETYFTCLEQKVKNPTQNSLNSQVLESIQTIQSSLNYAAVSNALLKILNSFEAAKTSHEGKEEKEKLCQDSMLNLIGYSNKNIHNLSVDMLQDVHLLLLKGNNLVEDTVSNVETIFSHKIFYFSPNLKAQTIDLISPNEIVCQFDKKYQIAMMEPKISSEISVFKYRIKPNASKWIAFGVCYKKMVQSKAYIFDYKSVRHGCYMISSNGGVWSSTKEELNNVIKAFTFKEGDTISCVVNRKEKEIFFIKDVNSAQKNSEIYSLPFEDDQQDELHACVTFYFEKDAVEYIPAIGLSDVPKEEYFFSEKMTHPKLKLLSNRMVRSMEGSLYRAAICSKSLQKPFSKIPKKFSFRISKCTNGWVAVGICHIATAMKNQFGFEYQSINHGYYMISANGGSWSSIDSKKNNTVKTFKFGTGEVVECEVLLGEEGKDDKSKIWFRKGWEEYELKVQRINGDELHPCIMMYHGNEEIQILPVF